MGLKNTHQNLVESFFIQHSLPRFPQTSRAGSGIFDSNIKHRAQHFVCVSMRDEFEGQKTGISMIPFESVANCNFYKLIWNYIRKVNVGFVTNHHMESSYAMAPFRDILRLALNDPLVDGPKQLSSFYIQSTGTAETRLTFQIFAKSPDHSIDIYDDVTSLFSVHHEDYTGTGPLKTGNRKGKSAMLMIAQSHSDPATLGINQKTLIDRKGIFAAVHILNTSFITLPSADEQAEPHQSMYRDHSKWSVNVIYGLEGNFPPLLCFYDLNRSTKQAARGGGAFCLNSSLTGSSRASMLLWQMFMSFSPKPSDMARFNEADIDDTLKQVVPVDDVPIFSTDDAVIFDAKSSSSSSSVKTNSSHDMSDYEDLYSTALGTRSNSIKRRRLSIGSQGSLTPAPSRVLFACAEMSEAHYLGDSSSNCNLLSIRNPTSEIPYQVPCPYKFKSIHQSVIKNEEVPAKVSHAIANAVGRYGLDKINESIAYKKLFISLQAPDSIFSPCLKEHQYTDYHPLSTILVSRRNPEKVSYEELNGLLMSSFGTDTPIRSKKSARLFSSSSKSSGTAETHENTMIWSGEEDGMSNSIFERYGVCDEGSDDEMSASMHMTLEDSKDSSQMVLSNGSDESDETRMSEEEYK